VILNVTSASVLPPAPEAVLLFGLVGSCFKITVKVPVPAPVVVKEVSIPIGFPFPSTSFLVTDLLLV